MILLKLILLNYMATDFAHLRLYNYCILEWKIH